MPSTMQKGLFKTTYDKQPRHLGDRADEVSWRAQDQKRSMRGEGYTACYAPIMSTLGKHDIICWTHPRSKLYHRAFGNQLSEKDFCKLIDLWKSVGFIPPEVWRGRRKGIGKNVMIIPRKGWDRHTVYVTLCLYRYSDALPRTMRAALKIHEQTGLPWLQVYQYAMASINKGARHGFVGFTNSVSAQQALGEGVNPGLSMALCKFGHLSLEERAKNSKENPCYVYSFFTEWVSELNPPRKKRLRWGKQEVPAYLYASREDILNPSYSPLFTTPDLSYRDLAWIMESTRKKE